MVKAGMVVLYKDSSKREVERLGGSRSFLYNSK